MSGRIGRKRLRLPKKTVYADCDMCYKELPVQKLYDLRYDASIKLNPLCCKSCKLSLTRMKHYYCDICRNSYPLEFIGEYEEHDNKTICDACIVDL